MSRIVWIDGCGQMARSNYREVAAAFDRVYALPRDRPLRIADALAELAAGPEAEARPKPANADPEPGW